MFNRRSFIGSLVNLCRGVLGLTGGSAACARDRLRVLILCDRVALGRVDLEGLKADMASVVLKYFDIDPSHIELEIKRRENETLLLATFPLRATGGANK